MLKWFFAHDKAILFSMGLILVLLTLVTSLLFPGWLYVIGAILIGYTLFSVAYFGGKEDVKKREAVRESNLLTSSECNMRTEKYLKKHMDNDLSAEKLLGNTSVPGKDWYTHVSEDWSSFCACFFASPKTKVEFMEGDLTRAASKCKEQTDAQNIEVNLILDALKHFYSEASEVSDKFEKHNISTNRIFLGEGKPVSIIQSREGELVLGLWNEFQELIANYPKSKFEENPCLESIESYANERQEHHEKILAIATVLLPDLYSLLNEAKNYESSRQILPR